MKRRKRILVAPLDWGLGHAARCIPLIKQLEERGCEILIASNGNSLALLNKEFPSLKNFTLPGYEPIYPSAGSMVWKMAAQLPKFLKTIHAEQQKTEELVQSEEIDVVISDNRYGCYSKKVKSIFITHQLHLMMPEGWGRLELAVNRFNRQRLAHFQECWVPDYPGGKSLAGKLAVNPAINAKFIGPLSRFEPMNESIQYDLLITASGPEPQRSLFIQTLEREVLALKKAFCIVWVYGDATQQKVVAESEKKFNYLTSQELNRYICQSNIIISRSGYSTIMDLARLGKKAIFIPTPSQTEQEYLASRLLAQNIAYSMPQKAFNLQKALKETEKFSGFVNFEQDNALLTSAISGIL